MPDNVQRRRPRSLASRVNAKPHAQRNSAPEPKIHPITFQPFGRHKHVEKLLDVSPNTVDRLIKEEGLPVIRLGGNVRFDLEAARAWAVRRQFQQTKSEEKAAG